MIDPDGHFLGLSPPPTQAPVCSWRVLESGLMPFSSFLHSFPLSPSAAHPCPGCAHIPLHYCISLLNVSGLLLTLTQPCTVHYPPISRDGFLKLSGHDPPLFSSLQWLPPTEWNPKSPLRPRGPRDPVTHHPSHPGLSLVLPSLCSKVIFPVMPI